MSSDTPGSTMMTTTATAEPFPSMDVLRKEHREFLRRHRDVTSSPDVVGEIERFLRRGQATGTVLDGERDRRDAQSILDYWATTLARTGKPLPEAELAEFDPELAPE